MTIQNTIENACRQAKVASRELANFTADKKSKILNVMAQHLSQQAESILSANAIDIEKAKEKQLSPALIDRLLLTKERIESIVAAVNKIAELPDPVGKVRSSWRVESGLMISRVSIPIGVIAIIYESRPNVTADAAALCIKSGNTVILRGGSECLHTNKVIVNALQLALKQCDVSQDIVQYIPSQERSAIDILLSMDQYVDVIIPRGGKSLIERIRQQSRIPVFSHLAGLCHTYIHADADPTMAREIVLNAKMRRTGICGATETLLIDASIANTLLPQIVSDLTENGCELRGDKQSCLIDKRIQSAIEADWSTEYLDAVLAIKVVKGLEEAINHIHEYGSNHTEAIITESKQVAALFQQRVNSAIVMHNCSTQFADGGEFGMGAEIGIATGKLHARGPVGVEQLTTFKYLVEGAGQVRS